IGGGELDLPGREEPMAEGGAPRADARERHVELLGTEEGREPLHGPPEGGFSCAPAHRLAEGDLGGELGERLAEELARFAASFLSPPDDVAAGLLLSFGGALDDLERVDRDAELR